MNRTCAGLAAVIAAVSLTAFSVSAHAQTVNMTLNARFILPGGIVQTGTGTASFDTTRNVGSGSIGFSGSNTQFLVPIIVVWLILCFPATGQGIPSIRDFSDNNTTATVVSNMGPVGTATLNVSYVNDVATVNADLSQLNFNAVPQLANPSTEIFSESDVNITPGYATAAETFSFSTQGPANFNGTNQTSYWFAGNPSGLLPPRVMNAAATITQTGSMTFGITGQITVSPEEADSPTLPQWAAIVMALWLVILSIWRIRHKPDLGSAA